MGLSEGITTSLSSLRTAIGSLMIVEFVVGLLGNYLLLHMFWRFKQLRTPSNQLLVALAVANLGMCCCIPFSTASMFSGRWIFDTTGCKLYGSGSMLFGLAVIGLLTSFSVDRYLCVCRRDIASTLMDAHYKVAIFVSYLNAFFWAVMPILGWARYDEDISGGCSVDWGRVDASYISYLFALTLVCFVFPITVMIVCFGRAHITAMKRPEVRDGTEEGNRDPIDTEWVKQKQVTKLGVSLLLVFLITWSPYALVCIWGAMGDPEAVPLWLVVLAPFMAKCSQILNPLMFFIFIRKFRDCVRVILFCKTQVEVIQLTPPSPEN